MMSTAIYDMKNSLILLILTLAVGCTTTPENGMEISNREFETLIISKSVKHLTYLTKVNLIEIDIADSALENFRDRATKLVAEGKIREIKDFRPYYRIATLESTREELHRLEKEHGLAPIEIKIRE